MLEVVLEAFKQQDKKKGMINGNNSCNKYQVQHNWQ